MAPAGPWTGPRATDMLRLPPQPPSLAAFRPPPPPRHPLQHRRRRAVARSRLADEPPAVSAAPSAGADPPDLLPPKFAPFVARNELRRKMLSYCSESRARDGRLLLVLPLSEAWVPDTADLLTDAFADAMGAVTVYKNFLRRQIRNYLRAHMDLPPKTVILIALLVDETALAAAEAAAAETARVAETVEAAAEAPDRFDDSLGDGMGAAGPEPAGGDADGAGVPLRWRALAPGPAATLAAAVEISFTESTRTKDLTGLDPPPERPYLCNMAVAATLQRQGLGAAVLTAAEDMVRAVGDDAIYLHLRFKDAPAAALYRAAGYAPVKQDSIFVRLIGQERRWLMAKSLKAEA